MAICVQFTPNLCFVNTPLPAGRSPNENKVKGPRFMYRKTYVDWMRGVCSKTNTFNKSRDLALDLQSMIRVRFYLDEGYSHLIANK